MIEPSAIRVTANVNYGDHAETDRHAIRVTRETTLGELLDEHCSAKDSWSSEVINQDVMIELRPILERDSNGK